MRDVTLINREYFEKAVNDLNNSPIAKELELVQINLGPELMEGTLKVYMEQIEAIPPERETEIPPACIEVYNLIFDENYVIPEKAEKHFKKEEQKVTEETQGAQEAPAVETPKEETKKKRGTQAKGQTSEKKAFLSTMIAESNHTRKEIAEAYVQKFGGNIGTPLTALTDGKNPKYNRFDKLVVEKQIEDRKVLSFE